MYTITASEQQSFLTTDFMPVSTDDTVSARATDGKIEDTVIIVDGGESGTNGTYTDVDIRGDGTGGKATVTVSGGAVTAVSVTTAGSGYTFATISDADIITAGGTGDYVISGLPFNYDVSHNAGKGAVACDSVDFDRTASGIVGICVGAQSGTDSDFLRILQIEDNAGFRTLPISQAAASDFFEFTYTYATTA